MNLLLCLQLVCVKLLETSDYLHRRSIDNREVRIRTPDFAFVFEVMLKSSARGALGFSSCSCKKTNGFWVVNTA